MFCWEVSSFLARSVHRLYAKHIWELKTVIPMVLIIRFDYCVILYGTSNFTRNLSAIMTANSRGLPWYEFRWSVGKRFSNLLQKHDLFVFCWFSFLGNAWLHCYGTEEYLQYTPKYIAKHNMLHYFPYFTYHFVVLGVEFKVN